MSNTFRIKNTRGTVIATIREGAKDTSTSLVLHGRGYEEPGFDRDQNLVYLLENFNSTTPPSTAILGQLWWRTGDEMYVRTSEAGVNPGSPLGTTGSPPSAWTTVVPAPQAIAFIVAAGAGLTGGGRPTGSPLTTTLNVGAGTGITVTANAISTDDSAIVHDSLSGFVATEHINHTSVNIVPEGGMVGTGPNNITASGSIRIEAGSGIQVGTQNVSVNSSVIRDTGDQAFGGVKTFEETIRASSGTATVPSYAFGADPDTGMYLTTDISNELSFTTGGVRKFRIETAGVLRSLITNYETLLTHPDDIPNKKYVDDNAPSGGTPTATTNVGVWTVSVTPGKKYLISCYGPTGDKGVGFATLGSVRLTEGIVSGVGSLIPNGATPTEYINWPDGNMPQSATLIVTIPNTVNNISGAMDYISIFSRGIRPTYMIAVQLN